MHFARVPPGQSPEGPGLGECDGEGEGVAPGAGLGEDDGVVEPMSPTRMFE